jgi:hypothetical protein
MAICEALSTISCACSTSARVSLQRCATETDGRLVPLLRTITSPVAIFIDGIDEYFNKHIEGAKATPSVTGQLSPDVWYFAQLGLVEVAYQLRRINHHLKVFAAVRKEAYSRLPQTTVMAQQYRGSAVDIVYSTESLREIFVNNIRLEKSDRMVRSERKVDPVEAFLGRSKVVHTYTREEEDVFEYVCRHTLLRPRDLMTIGERLSGSPTGGAGARASLERSGESGGCRDRLRVSG